jgi:hypothetical protein
MMMFADARIIFKHDEIILKQFMFDAQLNLVSGQSGAGIKGMINNGQIPVHLIKDLTLTLPEHGEEAYINEDGTYRFSQLAAGTYSILVKAAGYKEQLISNIIVNTGAFSIFNITLVPEDLKS